MGLSSLGTSQGVAEEVTKLTKTRGEFKTDLSVLNHFYRGPQEKGESNHLFDMWEGQTLAMLTRHAGLTNNHALIINSHSRSVFSKWRIRQGLYPHDSLVAEGERSPLFSVHDLATFMGPEHCADIHNIVVGGCNLWGEFKAEEWRRYFANATNIVHVSSGDPGYQPMFQQVLFLPSYQIEPVYERKSHAADGSVEFYLESTYSPGSVQMEPYVADLFKPGLKKPYHTQVAGRELLAPKSTDDRLVANQPGPKLPSAQD